MYRYIFRSVFAIAALVCSSVAMAQGAPASEVDEVNALLSRLETFSCERIVEHLGNRQPDTKNPVAPARQHARRMLETYLILNRCALNVRTRDQILEGQLRGMVAALDDPHSSYYNEEDYAKMGSDISGHYSGVGLELEKDLGGLAARVVRVFVGSPAEQAGLGKGDLIFKLDNRAIIDFPSYRDFMEALRGQKGTPVRLFLQKKGEQALREVVLVREDIKRTFVSARMLPNKWLHMSVEFFGGTDVYDETRRMSVSLCVDARRLYAKALHEEPLLQGVVLDLGNNPGGLLKAAHCVTSLFAPVRLANKVMLSERTRDGIAPYPLVINPQDMLRGKPLVVLVDECSASASEVVAKVVQYYGYGIVVGAQTFGKGTVQTILSLYDGKTAVRYTSAEYLVGSVDAPAPVQGVGVTPDISLKKADGTVSRCVAKRERDLPGAITSAPTAKDISPRDVQQENPALYRAIIDMFAREPFGLIPVK